MGGGTLHNAFNGTNGSGASIKRKKKIPPKKGKPKNDPISWAAGDWPYEDEDGKTYAARLLNQRYGKGNYKKGAGSEFSKLQKYADTHFE